VVFPRAEGRRYVGVRGWPGAPKRSRRAGRNPLATGSEQDQNQRLGGRGGCSPGISTAPEGGGTTQRGDPAPGPMRCGTTASGNERMHQ
jgi:hypothetical protein